MSLIELMLFFLMIFIVGILLVALIVTAVGLRKLFLLLDQLDDERERRRMYAREAVMYDRD